MKREKQIILCLLLLAFIFRLFLMVHTYVIAKDGIIYISQARDFAAGRFARGLGGFYPPGYPALIALFSLFLKDFELAGGLVSVVFGSLALMPIYLLTRRMLGQKAALICGLFFACHPVLSRYVADVLSEGAYFFFFLWGIYFAWRALETKNLRYFPLTGVFAILAYLIRPEGLGLIVLPFLLIVGVKLARFRKFMSLKKCVAGLLLLSLPPLAALSPYLIYMKSRPLRPWRPETAGKWKLSLKVSISHFLGLGQYIKEEEVPIEGEPGEVRLEKRLSFSWRAFAGFAKRYGYILHKSILSYFDVLYPALWFLILVSFFKKQEPYFSPMARLFLWAFFIFYLLLFSLVRVSLRHLAGLVPLALPWASQGALRLSSLLALAPLAKRHALSPYKILPVVVLSVLIAMLPKIGRHQRTGKILLKEAGLWLEETGPPEPVIVGDLPRLTYYAGGKHIASLSYPTIVHNVRKYNADFLILRDYEENAPIINSLGPPEWSLFCRYPKEDSPGRERGVLIYRPREKMPKRPSRISGKHSESADE
ncbi:MAG: hypothetical protein AMS15_09625 [Planctomycetes bacterium DG_23]|nr:MAG: hypothetical protein AMS15_09625 [Planctomycetes bacterium DG_23]